MKCYFSRLFNPTEIPVHRSALLEACLGLQNSLLGRDFAGNRLAVA